MKAKRSLMVCEGTLQPAEQEKVERLDYPLAELLASAGRIVCGARHHGGRRVLVFDSCHGPAAIVSADVFVNGTNAEAVAMVDAARTY